MIPPKIPAIRFPKIDRIPSGAPIESGWFTLVYNPTNDKTYKAEMLEMPFLANSDFFRIAARGTFYNDWASGKLRPGRTTRIVGRTGLRPTSDILVAEADTRKVGYAVELRPDTKDAAGNVIALGDVVPVIYNPGNDTMTPYTPDFVLQQTQPISIADAAALIAAKKVISGQPYAISGEWNADKKQNTIYASGINATGFGIPGVIEDAAGVDILVLFDVASALWEKLSFDDLLLKENDWKEAQTFEKGIKLPAGAKVDEGGSAFFQRLDIGQRHYIFGLFHSLSRDAVIQWKPDEFINQDGDGDIGLSRASAGVLEVNDGRPGYLATLRAFDVEAFGALQDYNSITKIALALRNVAHVPGSKTLWVEGGLQSYQPTRGVKSRPYATLDAAQQAASDGDKIIVRAGGTGIDSYNRPYYTDSFLWEKNITIIFEEGAIFGGLFQISQFIGMASFKRRTLLGGEFLGRVLLWRQSSADCDVLIIGSRFTGIGYFEVNGAGSFNNSFITKAVLRYCTFESEIVSAERGPIQFIGRDDMGPVALEIDNTLVISPSAPALCFQANEASGVALLGGTELRAATQVITLPTSPTGYQIPESTWLSDQRPTGNNSGAPGASTFSQLGGSPRDNPALNAELNAINSLADNRRDLPTIAGNRFNDLVLETKVNITQLELKTNVSSIAAQVLQSGSIAVGAPRTGSPADVLAAIQADINGLGTYDYYIVRFQTTPSVSTDVTHTLITVSKA